MNFFWLFDCWSHKTRHLKTSPWDLWNYNGHFMKILWKYSQINQKCHTFRCYCNTPILGCCLCISWIVTVYTLNTQSFFINWKIILILQLNETLNYRWLGKGCKLHNKKSSEQLWLTVWKTRDCSYKCRVWDIIYFWYNIFVHTPQAF